MQNRILAILLFCAASVAALAQGGPPMITDDTGTVAKGHWEINTALTIERASGTHVYGLPLLDLNFGLSPNSQVKLEIPWLLQHANGQRDISGLGNSNLGVRWRFRDEDDHHRVAVSMYPQIEFNNPNNSVRRGLVDQGPEFLFPIQWQTALGRYNIGGDFGYRFKTEGPNELMYGLIVGTDLSESIEVMGEIHGTGPASNLRQSEVVLNFGSRIKLTEHANFNFSVGQSIRRHSDPGFIGYFGIQMNF